MAKVVTLKAKNLFGKDYTIMDSMANIKKINAGMKAIYNAIDQVDKKCKDQVTFADYNEAISNEVVKQVAKLLNLTKDDSEKLENMSYSEMFNFYSEAVNSFTGMKAPSVRSMQERINALNKTTKEDPKQNSEE